MALVPCPECGKPMSTQAPSCPSCGYAPQAAPARFAAVGEATMQEPGRRTEAVVWEGSPSLKLLLVQVLRTLIVAAAAIVAAILVHPVAVSFFEDLSAGKGGRGPRDGSPATLILMILVGTYLVIRAVVLTISVLRLRSTRYRLTNQRLVVEQGILSRTLDEVDLRTVDDSGFSQSPLERLQGIGTVWVIASDRTTPRLALRGIQDPRKLRETIREHAYRMSQGQVFTRST
ncbi:MAG TPA: PH domain-containing protein [Myxococcaceae bacterium]|nr:PH domain-containing protein [Myxococcaceae bacterium]